MSNWLLRIASVYFIIGVCFGIYMGATHDFSQVPVHAHLNLLGWVTLCLVGLLYAVRPDFAKTRLAKAHFVLHNIGLPLQCTSLFFLLRGNPAAEGPLSMGSSLIGLGVFCLVLNVWWCTGQQNTRAVNLPKPVPAAG